MTLNLPVGLLSLSVSALWVLDIVLFIKLFI